MCKVKGGGVIGTTGEIMVRQDLNSASGTSHYITGYYKNRRKQL